ncbi:MAG: virulence RhuM family protein [Bacteroidales bacterium]|nr:virulence RhuM family protein [Bacteroidales bacterium]
MVPVKNNNEIVLYQPDNTISIDVLMKNEMVWINRQQMASLFGRDVKTIGKHINNALDEELKGVPTVAKFATLQKEGNRLVNRDIEYYSLDMVLSVGYRVKSQRGVDYRRWANEVLKEYLIKGYSINKRFERLEQRVSKTEEKIDFFVKTSLPPVQGVFYDGQIFDAYTFISDLVRMAKKDIILIDNYIDDSVLKILNKRANNVSATIYTAHISENLKLDLQKHNSQYQPIDIKVFKDSHDRFLIIDNDVYHIGASLKDLGKKMFAFSKMNFKKEKILEIVMKTLQFFSSPKKARKQKIVIKI